MIKVERMKQPEECTSIDDARNGIDIIDRQIVTLLGERALYVNEVVKYKKPDKDSIIAIERKEEVLKIRREWAMENGLDPDVIETVYRTLIDYFIDREMKILNLE